MSIRIGRIKYVGGKKIYPEYDGYELVEVMTRSTKYGALSPYELKDPNGFIIENVWQFSKVYDTVPKSVQRYSQYDNTIVWDWPAETHVDPVTRELTPAYFKWRTEGFKCPYAVRYPVGMTARHKCLYSYHNGQTLDYIESRKQIYIPLYLQSVVSQPLFKKLLASKANLLIAEVDGPHSESMPYYTATYGVPSDFIVNDTVLCTPQNLKILLNDPKHPFGHGYCLGMALTFSILLVL